jgi:uridine kinase
VLPGEIIIVEGTLIFARERLRELMDLRVFLDITAETRLARRMSRDVRERGRTSESVIAQWRSSVAPMYDQYVAPSLPYADIVFTHDPTPADVEGLVQVIRERLWHRC